MDCCTQACIAIAKQRQKEAEEEARKEAEERKRRAEEKKRIKRMLEAAFDGDVDEMKTILQEVHGDLFILIHIDFLMLIHTTTLAISTQ